MSDRDCENCKHHTEKGCDSWDCEYEQRKTREDAISRQAVLDAFSDYVGSGMSMNDFDALWDIVVKAQSVNPQEQKTGHWILTDDDFVYCSECEDSYYPRPIDASWYYCPHCGAKMEESEE